MQFDSFSAFLDMGGYGFFVWLSFAVTLIVMAGLVIHCKLERLSLQKTATQNARRELRVQPARMQQQNTQGV